MSGFTWSSGWGAGSSDGLDDGGSGGSALGPPPDLRFGTLLVIRPQDRPEWVETVVLDKVSQAPWSFVVVDAQYALSRVDLSSAELEYILEETEGVSARLLLRQAGEELVSFEDASDGYPTESVLADLREEALEALAELRRSLRGGSNNPVLPLRRRLRAKTVDPTRAKAGKGKGTGTSIGLAQLGQSVGGNRSGSGNPSGTKHPTLEPDEHWVLSSLRPDMTLGRVCTPSASAVFLNNLCLDCDSATGTTFVLERVGADAIASHERNTVAEWQAYAGRLTPQEDVAAGCAAPTSGKQQRPQASLDDDEQSERPAAEDARTLWIDYDEQQERFKEWRKVCAESAVVQNRDYPLEGPVSCLSVIKHHLRHGGDPRLWLALWARERQVQHTDRAYHEMTTLIDALYYGGSYDQLNMSACASFEVICRRVQTITDAYSAPGKPPNWEMAKYLSGRTDALDGISRELRSWAFRHAKEDADILAARNRARGSGGGAPAAGAEEVDDAVADGGLPGGKRGRGRGRDGRGGRGRGLPPASP